MKRISHLPNLFHECTNEKYQAGRGPENGTFSEKSGVGSKPKEILTSSNDWLIL
jgi:hypothetical protein